MCAFELLLQFAELGLRAGESFFPDADRRHGLDENGNPMLTAKGKPILQKSYSVLQDDFFNAMRAAGYTDVERGERASTEEHLTVTQFKVAQESARLEILEAQVEKKEQQLQKIEQKTCVQKTTAISLAEIDGMGRKMLV